MHKVKFLTGRKTDQWSLVFSGCRGTQIPNNSNNNNPNNASASKKEDGTDSKCAVTVEATLQVYLEKPYIVLNQVVLVHDKRVPVRTCTQYT